MAIRAPAGNVKVDTRGRAFLILPGRIFQFFDKIRDGFPVKFRTLSDAQIESYLRKEQPYACSGSLRSEGLGIALLEQLHGDDPTALIGLPLIRLVAMLEQEGVAVL